MRELLEYEMPLCCPVWFSTQVWILQYDEECGKLARKLWNKYGFVLRSGAIDLAKENETYNMFYYLRSKNTNIFDNSIRGPTQQPNQYLIECKIHIDDFCDFFDLRRSEIIEENSSAEFDTLGGFILHHIGQIPRIGDRLTIGRVVVEVLEVSRRRVRRVIASVQPVEGSGGDIPPHSVVNVQTNAPAP